MKVSADNGVVSVTMTHDELGIIRYTLHEGRMKLETTAGYLQVAKPAGHASARETADRAKAADEALEAATQKWARNPH